MNKIKLIKLLDRILGTLLLYLLAPAELHKNIVLEKIKKILVIRPGGIGDFVLLLPAIRALSEKLPSAEIHVLCEKRNAGIAGFTDRIKILYLYDKGLDIFNCLRNKYDVVIDTEQWHTLSAIVGYLTRSPIRIGFDTNKRGKLFTHKIPYSHDDYEVYSFLNLLRPILGKTPIFDENKPFVGLDGEVPKENAISIFPGGSVKERRWSVENFGKVAESFSKRGYKIFILGSNLDKGSAEKIKEYAPQSINTAGKLSLKETAAIIKTSKALLTADSSLMHLAYAVGTPVAALFGAGIEKKWAPRGSKSTIINKHLSCSPCTRFGYTPSCKKNIECLTTITVQEVITALEKILG